MTLLYKTDDHYQFCEECATTTIILDLVDDWFYFDPKNAETYWIYVEAKIAEICGVEEGMIYFCDGCNAEIRRPQIRIH